MGARITARAPAPKSSASSTAMLAATTCAVRRMVKTMRCNAPPLGGGASSRLLRLLNGAHSSAAGSADALKPHRNRRGLHRRYRVAATCHPEQNAGSGGTGCTDCVHNEELRKTGNEGPQQEKGPQLAGGEVVAGHDPAERDEREGRFRNRHRARVEVRGSGGCHVAS